MGLCKRVGTAETKGEDYVNKEMEQRRKGDGTLWIKRREHVTKRARTA